MLDLAKPVGGANGHWHVANLMGRADLPGPSDRLGGDGRDPLGDGGEDLVGKARADEGELVPFDTARNADLNSSRWAYVTEGKSLMKWAEDAVGRT